MKKITKKLKGKKVLSLVLAAIMLATTFNIALPMLKLDASAAGSITTSDGTNETVTQTQIVEDISVYDTYATSYLNGASDPTKIIVPGLDPNEDYVIQGMTYYPKRDWMLVTAYHNADTDNGETAKSSKVFALNAATGDFEAMFSFLNLDKTTANTDHGGGIAVSEHNLYYSCGDEDQKIAYAPLSVLENAPVGQHTVIQLVDEITLYELGDAYTAYVCYDEGVLWAGNFFDKGTKILGLYPIAAGYNGQANDKYNSMVFGYKLAGNSSEEEWDYLKGKFANLLDITTASGSATANDSKFTWTAYKSAGTVNIAGTITAPSAAVGEFASGNNVGSFTLTEGVNYTIEFTANNKSSDIYMWSPQGTHCNVKDSTQTTITELPNGRYHYKMNFTAGLKPAGDKTDSSWPTTQSTGGAYTGTYTIRFDQDSIAAGESREFEITNIKISQTNTYGSTERVYDEGSAGSPTYALGLNNALKDVQYAVVDNGKLYLSRSYGSGTGNSVSFGFGDSSWLTVADIDLSVPGTQDITINTTASNVNEGTPKTIKAYNISDYKDYPMMPMSEGLCVVDDKIFITFESASNKYKNESGKTITELSFDITNCEKPVDVVWQLDPYALMELEIPEPENSIYYEKVSSMEEIEDGEYLIIHQSPEKDSVTQNNILYAINANGGLKGHKLTKSDIYGGDGYNAMVGHPITEYSIVRAGEPDSLGNVADKDRIYLDNPEKDDVPSARWTIEHIDPEKAGAENRYQFKTTESYFANCTSLYFDNVKIGMAPSNATYLSNMGIQESGNGNGGFWICNADKYFLWCNDGLSENYNKKITSFYIQNGKSNPAYSGIDEQAGTFHCDALDYDGEYSKNEPQNIIGGTVETGKATSYADGVFYIYKRVKDDIASTYESRVYTGLSAELQADGTYTIDLETYAISPYHYQYTSERPTDYIIVADTSSSMNTSGSAGLIYYDAGHTLGVSSFVANKQVIDKNTANSVVGYAFHKPEEELYFKHTDEQYYQLKLAIRSYGLGLFSGYDQRFWAYYVTDDGGHYILQNELREANGGKLVIGPYTYDEFIDMVENGGNTYTKKTSDSGAGDRLGTGLVNCEHYRFAADAGEFKRFDTMKDTVARVSDQILAQNPDNRIACVKYGADGDTAYFSKGTGNWATSVPTSDVNAFWKESDGLTGAVVAGILEATTTQTSNAGIEMKIASEIVENSGIDYTVNGERNLAVIFISDGIPGNDDGSGTATAANNVISYAYKIKKAGGFIYTIVMGQDTTFDRNTYMQAVSSTYAEATGMDESELGGRSVDGINYNLNLSACNLKDYFNIGLTTTQEVKQNAAVGIDSLNDEAIIRQELSQAFNYDEADYEAKFVEGEYDAIGRFTFKEDEAYDATTEEQGVVVNPVDGARCLTITGYNYAEEYIGNGNPGRKLRVRITGVLANENAVIQNTPISNTATTALYKSEEDMNNSTEENDLAFKYMPTSYFNIPEYTYVLDYGLKMLDTDVNGTLKSVSAGPTKQRDASGNLAYKTISENGLVEITNNNLDLLYHTTPTNLADSGYCLIQRPDGSYDWFKINVVPASNVLYEETSMTMKSGNNVVAWDSVGDAISTRQDLCKDGDVYGFDNNYDNSYEDGKTNPFSNGTSYKSITQKSNSRSETATFTFKGTGFDLISACGRHTGIQIVKIVEANKIFIVDTYNDSSLIGDKDYFTQVPIVNWTAPAHGTYTVEVTAAYLSTAQGLKQSSVKNNRIDTGLTMSSAEVKDTAKVEDILDSLGITDYSAEDVELVWFDDNSILNGGTGPAASKNGSRALTDEDGNLLLENFIDGFRVYNPLGNTVTDTYDPYADYSDTEKNVVYGNVIEYLAHKDVPGSVSGISNGIAYITGTATDFTLANYNQVGPANELYLEGGKVANETNIEYLSFPLNLSANERVMLGLRAVNDSTTITVTCTGGTKIKEISVNSATEMYYDISECLPDNTAGLKYVTITNTGSGILAVNHIKLSGSDGSATNLPNKRSVGGSVDATAPETSKIGAVTDEALVEIQESLAQEGVPGIVKNGVVIPVIEDEEIIPDDNVTPDDNNTNDGTNNDTNTEESEKEEFSIFSIIEMIIALIEKILYNAFGINKIA